MYDKIENRAVSVARGWIGTPYVHQASQQGAGCDCLGLIRGIWRDLYGAEPEPIPGYTADWAEAGRDEALYLAGMRHLVPVAYDAPVSIGEVLLFRMRNGAVAKHLGLRSETDRFIHAYEGCGVIEAQLSPPWVRRIAARFRFPDVT